MTKLINRQFQSCFISAPFGLDLGVIPDILTQQGVSWEWSKSENPERLSSKSIIKHVDFVLVVLNGTKADYRGVFDAGIATGLSKPIFLIQTKNRTLPIEFGKITVVKTGLSNFNALSFHFGIFLSTSKVETMEPASLELKVSQQKESNPKSELKPFNSKLEERVYQAIINAGGSAITHPKLEKSSRYRPDFLAWLGHLDAELLDPVAIEVTSWINPRGPAEKDEQILKFIQFTHIKMAFVLTVDSPPNRYQQLSPNILWFTVEEFEHLAVAGKLGEYVRNTRNRIAHGVK